MARERFCAALGTVQGLSELRELLAAMGTFTTEGSFDAP